MKKGITFIGMAGAGKSAIGQLVAQALGWKFVDLDKLILETQGVTHHQIMKERGEDVLAKLENDLTLNLDFTHLVFAPPGSMIYSPAAMEKIRRDSTVVYLKTTPEIVEKRLGDRLYQNGIIGLEEKGLPGLMAKREVLYEKYADFTFLSGEQAKEEMAVAVLQGLKLKTAL